MRRASLTGSFSSLPVTCWGASRIREVTVVSLLQWNVWSAIFLPRGHTLSLTVYLWAMTHLWHCSGVCRLSCCTCCITLATGVKYSCDNLNKSNIAGNFSCQCLFTLRRINFKVNLIMKEGLIFRRLFYCSRRRSRGKISVFDMTSNIKWITRRYISVQQDSEEIKVTRVSDQNFASLISKSRQHSVT